MILFNHRQLKTTSSVFVFRFLFLPQLTFVTWNSIFSSTCFLPVTSCSHFTFYLSNMQKAFLFQGFWLCLTKFFFCVWITLCAVWASHPVEGRNTNELQSDICVVLVMSTTTTFLMTINVWTSLAASQSFLDCFRPIQVKHQHLQCGPLQPSRAKRKQQLLKAGLERVMFLTLLTSAQVRTKCNNATWVFCLCREHVKRNARAVEQMTTEPNRIISTDLLLVSSRSRDWNDRNQEAAHLRTNSTREHCWLAPSSTYVCVLHKHGTSQGRLTFHLKRSVVPRHVRRIWRPRGWHTKALITAVRSVCLASHRPAGRGAASSRPTNRRLSFPKLHRAPPASSFHKPFTSIEPRSLVANAQNYNSTGLTKLDRVSLAYIAWSSSCQKKALSLPKAA